VVVVFPSPAGVGVIAVTRMSLPSGLDLRDSIKSNEKLENLKGRVYIGHAFAEKDTAKPSDIHKKYILSAPKASYFPNYIEQYPDPNGRIPSNYHTFMHDSAVIRGYKRYPVRKDIAVYNYEDKMDKVASGDRVPYVFATYDSTKQFEKVEDPNYVIKNRIPIDYTYYFEHQLKSALETIFAPMLNDVTELWKDLIPQKQKKIRKSKNN
jgi:hypothetical protein